MFRMTTTLLLLGFNMACAAQSALLQEYINIQHRRLGFNGTVLITKNNKQLYHITVGKASHELNVPISTGSLFRVASISKQFTAMLVVLANREGKLKLDDLLCSYFPAITDSNWKKINLHQLLTHTSGIPHNEGISEYWVLKSVLPLSTKQGVTQILTMKLLFQPGTGMKYSSPGYYLLATILEAVYNKSYETILQEKILQTLRLNHTGVYISGNIIPALVSGYHLLHDSLVTAPYRNTSLMKGSGDLYTSAADLTTWNNSFSTGTIWNDTLQKEIFTPHTAQQPHYGYGWYIRTGKRTAYYHGGGSFGCSAFSAWYPQEKISLVILSNVSVLPVTELWSDIEKILFNEPFELPAIHQPVMLTTPELQVLTGKYAQGEQVLDIFLAGDQLFAKLGKNPPFEIYAKNKFSFFGKKVNAQLIFNTDETGTINSLEVEVRGKKHHFNKKQ